MNLVKIFILILQLKNHLPFGQNLKLLNNQTEIREVSLFQI